MDVSDSWDDFTKQVGDAIEFLKSNREEILRLHRSSGIAGISLDFAVSRTSDFIQSQLFPPELIRLAGELSLAIEISIYRGDDQKD